jgi:hypothetical protein
LTLAVPGAWVTLSLSTADLLGSALFLGALVAAEERRDRTGAACLGLACLARETYLAVAAVALVHRLAQGEPLRRAAGWAIAAVPAIAWNAHVLLSVPGGTSGLHENFGAPFAGMLAKARELAAAGATKHALFEAVLFTLLLALAGAILAQWLRDRRTVAARLWAVPALVMLVLSRLEVLTYHGAYARVFQDLWLVSVLLARPGAPLGSALRTLLGLSGAASIVYVANFVTSGSPP